MLKNIKKRDKAIDFKYICIKKEYFDVNMIYLNYTNLKINKYIEVIYKSPSIFLDGLFFKTPPIHIKNINVIRRDNANGSNVIIKLKLTTQEHNQFINMLCL